MNMNPINTESKEKAISPLPHILHAIGRWWIRRTQNTFLSTPYMDVWNYQQPIRKIK